MTSPNADATQTAQASYQHHNWQPTGDKAQSLHQAMLAAFTLIGEAE